MKSHVTRVQKALDMCERAKKPGRDALHTLRYWLSRTSNVDKVASEMGVPSNTIVCWSNMFILGTSKLDRDVHAKMSAMCYMEEHNIPHHRIAALTGEDIAHIEVYAKLAKHWQRYAL